MLELFNIRTLPQLSRGKHEGLLEAALPLKGRADVLEHLQDLDFLLRPQVEDITHDEAVLEPIGLYLQHL